MRRLTALFIILSLLCLVPLVAQQLIYEGEWGYYALRPSALTSEKGIHIFPSQPNSDDFQQSVGSASLNSAVVAELLNANQGTLEYWFKPNWDGDDGIDHYITHLGNQTGYLSLYKRATNLLAVDLRNVAGGVATIDVSSLITAGNWYHVVSVWNRVTPISGVNHIKLYLNEVNTDDGRTTTWTPSGSPVIHLGSDLNTAFQLNGVIYGRILDRPLSAAEVSALYASGAGSLDSTVVTPDVRWMPLFSADDTGALMWPAGQGVTASTSSGVLTVDVDVDERSYNVGDAASLQDGTGFAASGPALVQAQSGTSLTLHSGTAFADLDGDSQYFYRTDADFPESGILGDLTIQAWVKTDTVVAGAKAIVSKLNTVGDLRMYRFWKSGTQLLFQVSSDGTAGNTTTLTSTNAALVVDEWAHVAVTYDASDGSATFYQNGIALTDNGTPLKNSIADKTPDFQVGAVSLGAQFFGGGLLGVALFDDIRTPVEVRASAADWDIDLSGEGNIIGQWLFDEAAAAAAIDNTQGDAGRDLTPYDGGDVTFATLRSVTGGYVQDIEKVGVSIDCAGAYYTQGGDILDITTEDFEIDFWMKQDGDPAANTVILGKGPGAPGTANCWHLRLLTDGSFQLRPNDGANDASIYRDITAQLDNRWHHYYLFADRSDISTCAIYIDGASVAITTSGVFPVNTLTNAGNFTIGATTAGAQIPEDNLRDVTIHIGGTMRTAAQILYRATHPLDYSASGWTLDGTREAWKLTEGSGTTNSAEVTSPANDLTLSNAAAWDQSAFVSRDLTIDGNAENGGIGAISDASIDTTITVTKDTSEVFADTQSLKVVYAASNDNVELEVAAPTLVSSGDYWNRLWVFPSAITDDSKLYLDFDGSATPILSREIGKSLGDNGEFARAFNLDATYYAQAANNTIHQITTEDIGVAAWIKADIGTHGNDTIFSKWDNSTGYLFTLASGNLRMYIKDGTDAFFVLGNVDLRDGAPHHVAAVIDKNNSANCKIFVDGVDASITRSGTIGDVGSLTNAVLGTLGAESAGTWPLGGEIRDVVLSYPADIMAAGEMGDTGEIANLYNNPGDPSAWPNSEDYWLCNDNAASTVVTGAVNNLTASANTSVFAVENWKLYEMCFEADQAAITEKLRISGLPEVVADSATLNPGTDTSGSVTDTYTQNGTDWVITEVTGSPGFDLEFDFTADGAKSFHLYGYYDGNIGHVVDVNAWNGSTYDTLGQIPDAVGDTLYDFTLTDAHTVAGAVNIQIDHSSPGNVNHDLYMDHVYLIDGNSATVYLDNGELREDMVANPGCEGGADPPASWVQEGSATVVSDTSPHSGTNCLKATAGAANVGASQAVTLVSGKYYTVTGWCKATAADTAEITVDTGDTSTISVGSVTSTLWTQIKATFLSTGTSGVIYLRGVANGDIVWFDDLMIVQNDESGATASKGSGYVPLRNPLRPPGD